MKMTRSPIGSQFAKAFQKNEILVPHLNNWFVAGKFPDELPITLHLIKEADDAFHPSSALMCLRTLQANMDGLLKKRENTLEAVKTFAFGHYIHGLIQWICVDLGFAKWEDIEVDCDFHLTTPNGNPYRVRGFPDIAKCIVPNHEPILVDIKTANAHVYSLANLPRDKHEAYQAQVQLYLDFVGLDKGILLMAEKDHPHRFKEIVVERDDRKVDRIVKGWESMVDNRATGKVSPCTCDEPEYCPAKDCYDEEILNNEINYEYNQ